MQGECAACRERSHVEVSATALRHSFFWCAPGNPEFSAEAMSHLRATWNIEDHVRSHTILLTSVNLVVSNRSAAGRWAMDLICCGGVSMRSPHRSFRRQPEGSKKFMKVLRAGSVSCLGPGTGCKPFQPIVTTKNPSDLFRVVANWAPDL
jgi:hypothetical protein